MPRGGHAMNKMLLQLGINAKEAENTMRTITTDQKNQVLAAVADHLIASTDKLLEANAVDVANAKQNHMPEGLVDRLMLSPERLEVITSWIFATSTAKDTSVGGTSISLKVPDILSLPPMDGSPNPICAAYAPSSAENG